MMAAKDWKTGASGRKFVASFSGGKDSTLALFEAMKIGQPLALIVVLQEDGQRSQSHAMTTDIIRAQSMAIGLDVYFAATNWENYERTFIDMLKKMKALGAEALVTGDLDMPEHGCWHEKVANIAGLHLGMPLWETDHEEVVRHFVNSGFETMITTVNLSLGMTIDDLGQILTHDYIDQLKMRGIDPCGEGGEFHTTVTNGPLFKEALAVQQQAVIVNGNYAYLPLTLLTTSKI